jgi:uncharacterized protein YwlG (UPF0340 family)
MLKMALGGVAALTLVVTIAIGRWSSSVVAAEPDQAPFDETWRDAAMPLAFKSAELANNIIVTDITVPKIVQVETVKMVPEIVALPDSSEGKPVAKRKLQYVERDVCTRHGMHKVTYGKRWKCGR